jgi:hypothetical protein
MMEQYMVCDARYGLGQEWKDTMCLLIDTAEECCRAVNEKDYGKMCVVAELDGEILWEWNHTGKWKPEGE